MYLRYLFANGEHGAIEFERVGIMTDFEYTDDLFGEDNRTLKPTMQLIHTQNEGIINAVKNSANIRFLAKVANMLKPEDIKKERQRFTEDNLTADNDSGMIIYDNKFSELKQVESKPYATTFDAPYLLYEFEDGTKIYERIDAHALDGADMSDVIMQYDHEGRVFARQSNKTLILQPDYKGLKVAADLGKTDLARGLYQDIEAGMINKMSWAFSVAEESYDRETHTRTILKIKKVYDVSAVSIPANGDTEISARAFASRSYEQERQELLKRRAAILKIRASL